MIVKLYHLNFVERNRVVSCDEKEFGNFLPSVGDYIVWKPFSGIVIAKKFNYDTGEIEILFK